MLLLLVQRAHNKITEFFTPLLFPFLALCMMGNNIIRAEGKLNYNGGHDYSILSTLY
jgi:hypothetical protein